MRKYLLLPFSFKYGSSTILKDIPVIPTLLAKAKSAKGIDYVGYHFMQYDSDDKNLSEHEKCLALAKKLSVFRKMIEELKDNLNKIFFKYFIFIFKIR